MRLKEYITIVFVFIFLLYLSQVKAIYYNTSVEEDCYIHL
jgi:hypothetical protein